jgi:hypothetical protein
MDTTSIVTSHPASADGEAGLRGAPAPDAQVPIGEGAMTAHFPDQRSSTSQIRSTPSHYPTKVVRL